MDLEMINRIASKMMNNKRGKVKLGLIAAEIALGGIIAYNIATAPPNSSISPVNIFTPKEIPGATVTSDSVVNPPSKLTVTLKPGGGTYFSNTYIRLSSNVPCKMFWNAHGKDPRKYGEPYTGPILLAAQNGQTSTYKMRFYGVHEYGISTGIGAADFVISPNIPVQNIPNDQNVGNIARACRTPTRILDWVRYHIGYKKYYDSQQSISTTLRTGRANCCDGANLLAALFTAAGYSATGCTCGHNCCGVGHCVARLNYNGRVIDVDWLLCGANQLHSDLYPALNGGAVC